MGCLDIIKVSEQLAIRTETFLFFNAVSQILE